MYLYTCKMNQEYQSHFQLEAGNPKGLEEYLRSREFLADNEVIELIEVAGEGNMNVVLRAKTQHRSFILKQTRPWVKKYPQVQAPVMRVESEYKFYGIAQQHELIKQFTPEIYFFDKKCHLICLQDFGPASDYTSIYRKEVEISRKDIADVVKTISALHHGLPRDKESKPLHNLAMRVLNHHHIFEFPFRENNGFNLDQVVDGLQAKTNKFRTDKRLKAEAERLGEMYLTADSNILIHGDYYPGSWLKTNDGFKMIDPEFCFYGIPEFEVGVTLAHLVMAEQRMSVMKDLFLYYYFDDNFDAALMSKFAGIEIMRRVIGLAQLPLEMSLDERLVLLDRAYEMIV